MEIVERVERVFKTLFTHIVVAVVVFVAACVLIPSVNINRTVQVIEHNCTDQDTPLTPNKHYSL